MKIKSVEFAGAIGQVGQAEPESVEGLPQVAFAGRSNVGKSSLINRVLGRTRTPIARVSQHPGKTQEINFYHVAANPADFCLVDFPGYGYAKVPQAIREKWRPLINGFLTSATKLSGVVQLIDMRHGPTPDDLAAVDYLGELEIPVLFVLTKADKLTPTQRQAALVKIPAQLAVHEDQVLPVSAQSGLGIEDLVDTLGSLLFPVETSPPEQTDMTSITSPDRTP
jgi:GTP-binding protein